MEAQPKPLPRALGKHHWSVEDIFPAGTAPACAFRHRDYAIGMHTHAFIEINLVVAGRGWHHLEDHVFPLAAGDAFVIPEGARHGYERRGRLEVDHLLLHPRFLAEHLARLQAVPGFLPLFTVEPYFRAGEGVRHRLRLDRAATAALAALLAGFPPRGGREPADVLTAEALALAAVARLCRAWSGDHPGPAAAASPRMDAVLAVIDTVEQRHAEPLHLGDLAAAAGLAPSACCRLFRAVTGASPMEHLRQVRIRHAGVLLRSGLPLADVAARTGFCDAAHLARVFRRQAGVTPGAWRAGDRPGLHHI
ncbi:MAG: AraC family transcriptional regulator [Planctomycetes bacterium]|nr:AraC family transcriptional regulator [Planctomycetota bacterium]